MRNASIWFGSTAGRMASGVQPAAARPWPDMVGTTPKPNRQRYRCKDRTARFDDLSGTILAGHHRPLRTWVLCLYFMGLTLSNQQIARELDLGVSDVQAMTGQLRSGPGAKIPPVGRRGGSG
jgi:hypothetical protein